MVIYLLGVQQATETMAPTSASHQNQTGILPQLLIVWSCDHYAPIANIVSLH